MAKSNSYHCLCSTFVLATNYDLGALPARKGASLDKAIILPLQENIEEGGKQTILQNTVSDSQPTVIRRDDGFEKRILLRCQRCNLVLGYHLDQSHFEDGEQEANSVAYILPGGLLPTEDLTDGKMPAEPDWTRNQ